MRRQALALGLIATVFLGSCGQSPPAPHPVVAEILPARASPSATAVEAPPPSAQVTPQPPAPAAIPRHKVAVTLEPGKSPCTLVFDGAQFEDHPAWFVTTSVTRMATDESEGCSAGVFYDFANEKRSAPDAMDPEPLVAGTFHKPGQTPPADVVDEHPWNLIEDLNFDGVADLCVVVMTGAYNYSQMCWLFDIKSRTFVRHGELDDLIFMEIDKKTKKLKNAFRAGGPVYENNEYEWQKGTLVQTYHAMSYFGEKPDGTPLGPGFSHWVVRHELRNGKLVKTFEGAFRDKP